MRHATRSSAAAERTESDPARLLRLAALIVAATFVLVGIAGFVPGLTTDYEELEFAGPHDGMSGRAELLGLFHVSVLHNLVHLTFGLVGLLLARSVRGASGFLIGGGIVYALVFVYGLVVDHDSDANFLPVNDADNVLHAGLAAGMVLLGLLLTPRRTTAVTRRDGA